MDKIISVKINKHLEKILNRYSEEKKEVQSELIRLFIKSGSLYLAIKGYARGQYSIGMAAYLADLPLSEFMDIFMELGIKSKVSRKDLLEGYENLKEFF